MTAEEYLAKPFHLREKLSCLKRVQQALLAQGEKERAEAVGPYIERTEKEQAAWHRRVAQRIALLPDENERRALTLRFLEGLSPRSRGRAHGLLRAAGVPLSASGRDAHGGGVVGLNAQDDLVASCKKTSKAVKFLLK